MSKTLTLIFALAVIAFAASPAHATNYKCKSWMVKWNINGCGDPKPTQPKPTTVATNQVPELSASAAPISIALVGGLLAFGLERRRKQANK